MTSSHPDVWGILKKATVGKEEGRAHLCFQKHSPCLSAAQWVMKEKTRKEKSPLQLKFFLDRFNRVENC